MTEEPQKPPAEQKKRAGGIRQYATLGGGGKTLERPGARTPRSQDAQEPKRLEVQTPERQDAQESKRLATQTPRSQDTQEPGHPGASAEKRKRERHTIYLPPALSEWLKIRAIKERCEISELTAIALERYRAELEGE